MNYSVYANNYKPKIKNNTTSTTPNTKINQYPNKNRKIHRTPINTLNKSQNFSIAQRVFKKNNNNNNIIANNNKIFLQSKKLFPIQNQNPKKINFINKNIKLNLFQFDNNKNIIKTNSLSKYFNKNKMNHNLRRNFSNTNIINITNTNTTNYNEFIKNNYIYQTKSNLYKLKKNPIIKIKDYLTTEDLSISKNNNNKSTSIYPLVITEESKKNLHENLGIVKIQKNDNSTCNSFVKNNYPAIKSLKTSSTAMLIKPNFILNTNNSQNNIIQNKRINTVVNNNLIENLSTEKNSRYANLDTFENKIINEIKDIKNSKKNEIVNKIKIIFEEVIEYLVPKESQTVFLLLVKEIFEINKEYSENITQLNEEIENYKIKISNYDNKFKDLSNKLKTKEKELKSLKKEIENFNNEKKKLEISIKNNDNNINNKKQMKKNYNSSINLKVGNDHYALINKINAKNVDDLDALYFFDKINYNQNDGDKNIPKLNLEEKYIENCIKKEIIKRNEINLTPFQKVALQFEMLDT
jgi:hypothetical protein